MGNFYKVNFHHIPIVITKDLLGNVQMTCANYHLQLRSLEKLQSYTSIGLCTVEQARHYIRHKDECTNPDSDDPQLLGHSRECHVDENACGSTLLYLR